MLKGLVVFLALVGLLFCITAFLPILWHTGVTIAGFMIAWAPIVLVVCLVIAIWKL